MNKQAGFHCLPAWLVPFFFFFVQTFWERIVTEAKVSNHDANEKVVGPTNTCPRLSTTLDVR
jgi:hypothetical protein